MTSESGVRVGLGYRRQNGMIRIVDADGYAKHFIVHSDEILTAFLELERRYTSSR
jgi:hypothetical protein